MIAEVSLCLYFRQKKTNKNLRSLVSNMNNILQDLMYFAYKFVILSTVVMCLLP